MRGYGLIGNPLGHSFSKKYFEEKFRNENISGCSYDLFPLNSVELLPMLLQTNVELCGLNVTIPYKESVLPFLNSIDAIAEKIGAVNCIDIRNKRLTGYNTDAVGFEISLKKFTSGNIEQAFVLGTGGSSKAICFVLEKLSIPYNKVSREKKDGEISYSDVSAKMRRANLFINCTPLGMFPKTEETPPIPFDRLTASDLLYDLVYNPEETLFLQNGKAQGAKTKNGLEMLELQAEESWRIWNL